MVGTHGGDRIGEVVLAIEMGVDAVDIGKTIHPQPTLGYSIGMAAEVAHGSCTDVPPARKLTMRPRHIHRYDGPRRARLAERRFADQGGSFRGSQISLRRMNHGVKGGS